MTHYLYRLYNGRGRLLYVGTSKDPWARFAQHRRERPIMTEAVRRGRITVHASELDAKRAEREAITTEHPVFNVAHRRPTADWSREDYRRFIADTKALPASFDFYGVRSARIRAARLAYAARFGEPVGPVARTNPRTAKP